MFKAEVELTIIGNSDFASVRFTAYAATVADFFAKLDKVLLQYPAEKYACRVNGERYIPKGAAA